MGVIEALRAGEPVLLPADGVYGLCSSVDEAAKLVVRRQLEHLRAYPVVTERLARGELSISGWFYDVEQADVLEWNEAHGSWAPLGERRPGESLVPPPETPDSVSSHAGSDDDAA